VPSRRAAEFGVSLPGASGLLTPLHLPGFPAEGRAQASFCFRTLPPHFVEVLPQVCRRPTWVVSPRLLCMGALSSHSSAPEAQGCGLGSASRWCPPLRQRRGDTEQQDTPGSTACCQGRHSWLSQVCIEAFQTLSPYPPVSRLLLALPPCCPQELCWPLAWSVWDPGWGRHLLRNLL